jgi:uncharacterized UPF0160 family protein
MRKKSKYKPKNVRTDNLQWILSGMKKVGSLPTAGVALKLKNHEALDALLKGAATRDDIDVLIASLNMAEAMYMLNPDLGADWKDEIKDAQDAIYTLGKRCAYNDHFACTGLERKKLLEFMEIHNAQLDECTVKTMEEALYLVSEMIRLKKARPILEAVT